MILLGGPAARSETTVTAVLDEPLAEELFDRLARVVLWMPGEALYLADDRRTLWVIGRGSAHSWAARTAENLAVVGVRAHVTATESWTVE